MANRAANPASHAFFTALLDHLRERHSKLDQDPRASLTHAEWYDARVSRCAFNWFGILDRLQLAAHLARTYPTSLARTKKLSREKWFDYHLASWVIAYSSLAEGGALLVASVFRLDLPEKYCSPELVASHAAVRRTLVARDLKELDKLVQPKRESRNRHVHRGEKVPPPPPLDTDAFTSLYTVTFLAAAGHHLRTRAVLQSQWRAHMQSLNVTFAEDLIAARRAINTLLDALLPIYSSRRLWGGLENPITGDVIRGTRGKQKAVTPKRV